MADNVKTKDTGSMKADTRASEAQQQAADTPVQGAASENAYGGSNTRDYSGSITDQYAQFVEDQNAAVEATVQDATDRLGQIQAAGERAAEASAEQAKQDRSEIRQTRKAMERNEGNRQGIGESQYGVAENAYDQQMAVIEGVKQKLRTDVARQVSDLRAKGDFAAANAALETAQAQFRQLYEEGLRVGGNLRGNYEYQTQLQREDAAIQREQDNADLDWKRTMGEFMLKHGVTPSEDLLSALGIDSSAANLYINAVTNGYYGSGGGSGSGSYSGSPSGSPSGTPDLEDIQAPYLVGGDEESGGGALPFGTNSNYNASIANRAIAMAEQGDLDGAWTYLTQNASYFSEANYGSLLEITQSKYDNYLGNYYDSYYAGYAGGGAANNWGMGSTGGGGGTTPTPTPTPSPTPAPTPSPSPSPSSSSGSSKKPVKPTGGATTK